MSALTEEAFQPMRVLRTFDEWRSWTAEDRKPSVVYPTATAAGELADQIRRRFGAEPHAPIRIVADQYEASSMYLVMSIDCHHADPSKRRDASFARWHTRDYHWAAIREWLEDDE